MSLQYKIHRKQKVSCISPFSPVLAQTLALGLLLLLLFLVDFKVAMQKVCVSSSIITMSACIVFHTGCSEIMVTNAAQMKRQAVLWFHGVSLNVNWCLIFLLLGWLKSFPFLK